VIYEVVVDDKPYRIELVRSGLSWRCKVNGREFPADVIFSQTGVLSFIVDGKSYEVRQEVAGAETSIVVGRQRFRSAVADPRSLRSRGRIRDSSAGVKKISAPMPGKVVRILAPLGATVETGQPVLVIEAMKMQNELKSPRTGRVKRLAVSEGAAVEAGQVLAEVE
jgi:biotin carboxyl carrier protein